MLVNTDTIVAICKSHIGCLKCPLNNTGLCEEAAVFEMDWDTIGNACKQFEEENKNDSKCTNGI